MKRRNFIKSTLVVGGAMLIAPKLSISQDVLSSEIFWKIEPSGICVKTKNNNLAIQIRYCIYLGEKAIGFEVKKVPQKDSSFKDVLVKSYQERLIEEIELIEDGFEEDNITPKYKEVKTGNYINVPLHNHIILMPYNVSDSFIEKIGNQLVDIVREYRNNGYFDDGELVFIPNNVTNYDVPTDEKIKLAEKRVQEIKNNTLWLQ